MDIQLSEVEVRVLGVLVEKELTTPEYYPLTPNAIRTACNQKSNREPVVSYDQAAIIQAVESLRDKNLALMVTGAGSRAAKYRHTFPRRFQFDEKEVAVLCVLMLRGPQTIGEIRGRSSRLYNFDSLDEVGATLSGLAKRGAGAYVLELPRLPGRKEARHAHLFCGEPDISELPDELQLEPIRRTESAENERLASLEAELKAVKNEVDSLKQAFAAFKQQFE